MAEAEGIPPTASVASVGQRLNYVGEWVYALSGPFEASDTSANMFSFTTGTGIIKGEFVFNGQVRYVSGSAGGHSVFELRFNDFTIGVYKSDTAQMDQPNQLFQKVIIPPFTEVLVKCISGENTATELLTATFSGRVYDV